MTSIKSFYEQIEFGRYSIGPAIEAARRCQELTVETDNQENIIAISHASGAQARLNASYTIARSNEGSLWFGDRAGLWHPLD
ncbi:MAG: hypothetical protein K2Y39_20970 [Candidatus Obscuribacterales bacterium]|nr:hypothetical protein [Candidatus Obscuribacterales bacterium]